MTTRGDHPTGQRFLGLCGVAAPLVFLVGVIAAGFVWDGYSHATQTISDLGGTASPNHLIQNVNFVSSALLVAALALGIHRSVGTGSAAGSGPLLIGYFGAVLAAQAVFPCTPGCEERTFTDIVHVVTAITGFVAFAAGTLILSRRMREDPEWRSIAGYTKLTGIATFVGLMAWLVVVGVDPVGLYGGLVQRAFVAVVFAWIGVAGVRVYTSAAAGTDPGGSVRPAG